MVDTKIKVKKAYNYIVNEGWAAQNIGITEQNCHNCSQKCRRCLIIRVDAQSVFNFVKVCKHKTLIFYAIQTYEDGLLMNLLWRYGVYRSHYEVLGNVLIFDTTYRTNKYNMVCAPFVGINNHWKNIYFLDVHFCVMKLEFLLNGYLKHFLRYWMVSLNPCHVALKHILTLLLRHHNKPSNY